MNPVASLPSGRVAEAIREQLVARGSAWAAIADLPVTVAEWRRIARQVARDLGRPVATTAAGGVHIHAMLTDWPANDDEQRITEAQMRAAVEAAALSPAPAPPALRALD